MSVTMSGTRTAAADPAVEGLDAATYVVPTDAPAAGGTLAWDKTTLVLVPARGGLAGHRLELHGRSRGRYSAAHVPAAPCLSPVQGAPSGGTDSARRILR